jgi:16S rRNA (cytidine1402-2'-O)-methyltransferase
MSILYVVATPIGNLEDITFRAVRVLGEVDYVLCEDTRMTRKLLSHYEIKTPTISYHANSKITKMEKILELLEEGKNLALVSDAGTPTISDPGVQLIAEIREKMPEVKVLAIPGASALTAAISVAGAPSARFEFLGFLPHKKGRETIFSEIAASDTTNIFYESPHRILKTLESLAKHCPNKKVSISRELTKIYESFVSGTPAEVLQYYDENPEEVRGEFVVILSKK